MVRVTVRVLGPVLAGCCDLMELTISVQKLLLSDFFSCHKLGCAGLAIALPESNSCRFSPPDHCSMCIALLLAGGDSTVEDTAWHPAGKAELKKWDGTSPYNSGKF